MLASAKAGGAEAEQRRSGVGWLEREKVGDDKAGPHVSGSGRRGGEARWWCWAVRAVSRLARGLGWRKEAGPVGLCRWRRIGLSDGAGWARFVRG